MIDWDSVTDDEFCEQANIRVNRELPIPHVYALPEASQLGHPHASASE